MLVVCSCLYDLESKLNKFDIHSKFHFTLFVVHNPEDGMHKLLRNVCNYLPVYTNILVDFMLEYPCEKLKFHIVLCLCLISYNGTCVILPLKAYCLLTLRRLMSYIHMEHPFWMFLDHTQRRSTVGRTSLDE